MNGPSLDTTAQAGEVRETMQNVYLARQPIVDRDGELYGFELLFREGEGPINVTDGMLATSTVMGNVLNELGIQQVLGRLRGFLNVDAQFISSQLLELLPPERIVLEILESAIIDEPLIDRCRELRKRGFDIALDDYIGDFARIEPLLSLVSMVKIDLAQVTLEQLDAVCAPLRDSGVMLIAEKVETERQFLQCRD